MTLNVRLDCDITYLKRSGLSDLCLLTSTPWRLDCLFLISLWYLQTLSSPNHNLCHGKNHSKIACYLSLLEGLSQPHTTYNFKYKQQSSQLKPPLARCSCCPSADDGQSHLNLRLGFLLPNLRAASRAASPVAGDWGGGLSLLGLPILLAQWDYLSGASLVALWEG